MKTVSQMRKQLKLPGDGRDAVEDLERIEAIAREVLGAQFCSYDVHTVQQVDFDEYSYSEGIGCFIIRTQSHELNTRLVLGAAEWTGKRGGHAKRIAKGLAPKWTSDPVDPAQYAGLKVYFAPGGNMGWIVNPDNALRAFAYDGSWRCKPHPVTAEQDIAAHRRAFGQRAMLDSKLDGIAILRGCDAVGYTTSSEMGVMGMLLGKDTIDFTAYRYEGWGFYQPLYRAIRESEHRPAIVVDRVLSCPWSGWIPLEVDDADARTRLRAFKAKAEELRAQHSPMTQPLRPPPQRRPQ